MSASHRQPVSGTYPDAAGHRRRWRHLAREIAARAATVTDDLAMITPPDRPGSLEILGSGIEAVGFTRADEARIQAADRVFYCVADPATKVWLLSERPDAYDLYALYDDTKRRYLTYMQMAEAMLHPVRQGRHVVAVFYGHPGIFVLATHRAIRIARREGHRAEMRPAVSALDTLCADLGVDPSQPGMQMYEATDMLIRARRPDPGLHLVLWQVGLIGELGYRRQGYLNSNFSVLLDYLEELYGPDHPIVNYVGSRYPGVEPLMDHQTVRSLRDPAVQSWVTGISTFYLPPKQAAPADPATLVRLGLLRAGQTVRDNTDPLRAIDRYGPRERRAFTDFATFDVPRTYQWQPDTEAARFVLALCDSAALRERYRTDPAGAVASWGRLSARERDLLSRRDPGAIQLAAKGLRSADEPENRRLLTLLLSRKTASASLLAAVTQAPAGAAHDAATAWSRAHGIAAAWESVAADLQQVLRSSLAVWTGLYLVPSREISLSILGRPGGVARVDLNGRRLKSARFEKGVLSWTADAETGCSGYLQPDLTPGGRRRWIGLIWPAGSAPDPSHKVVAGEHLPRPRLLASAIAGTYRVETPDSGAHTVSVLPAADRMVVSLDGKPSDAALTLGADHFRLSGLRVPLAAREAAAAIPDHLQGSYRMCVQRGRLTEIVPFEIGSDTAVIADQTAAARRAGNDILWTNGPPSLAEGRVTLMLDPVTLQPLAHGTARAAGGATAVLRGMARVSDTDITALAAVPRLGLSGWAWRHLVAIMAEASAKGGLFLWDGYDRAATNLVRVRQVLAHLHRDEMDGARCRPPG